MDKLDLHLLPQISIEKPCSESWDTMDGDDQKRFCQGCGCHVHNLAELTPDAAESILASPGRTCVRMTTDPQRGILTKLGWIPKMALAGALAATVSGCMETNTGDVTVGESAIIPKSTTPVKSGASSVAMGTPAVAMGKPAHVVPEVKTTLGETARSVPIKPGKTKAKH